MQAFSFNDTGVSVDDSAVLNAVTACLSAPLKPSPASRRESVFCVAIRLLGLLLTVRQGSE